MRTASASIRHTSSKAHPQQGEHDRGITTLVVSGISTSGVVLSTAIDTADRDYRLHVLSDGVADPDPEVHSIPLRVVT